MSPSTLNIAPDSTMKKRVHVAVGVISDGADRILISRRADHLHQGGLWEFPGGKVEQSESVIDALRRELFEELAIEVAEQESLITIEHDYADKAVFLDVWWVRAFAGEPRGCEGQPLCWVAISELQDYEFPAANQPIIAAIQQKLTKVDA
jgi:8-oxo-dGTP diphosphatase